TRRLPRIAASFPYTTLFRSCAAHVPAKQVSMDRSNPYETAFEAFLQEQGLCYVAVDETRRAILGDVPVKNLDFIVLGPTGAKLRSEEHTSELQSRFDLVCRL